MVWLDVHIDKKVTNLSFLMSYVIGGEHIDQVINVVRCEDINTGIVSLLS